MKQMGGSEEDYGHRTKVRIIKYRSPEFQPKMEGIVYLVVEWISVKEMKALHSACMLVSTKAREKEFEEFPSDQETEVWKGISEEWQKYLMGKEESLAM